MLAGIIAKLVAWPVIGPFLKLIADSVLTWQKNKLDAQGAHEVQVGSLAAKALELDKREAEVQGEIIRAEQGNWLTRSVRPLMALPVVVVLWKVLIYDKALGQWTNGTTDALDEHLWWVMTTIIVAYMGGRSAEKIANKIAGIWK